MSEYSNDLGFLVGNSILFRIEGLLLQFTTTDFEHADEIICIDANPLKNIKGISHAIPNSILLFTEKPPNPRYLTLNGHE